MNAMVRKFLIEEDGVTAIEYGVLAAIVAAAIVAGFKTQLGTLFTDLFSQLEAAVKGTS